jgi:hypothetical protein
MLLEYLLHPWRLRQLGRIALVSQSHTLAHCEASQRIAKPGQPHNSSQLVALSGLHLFSVRRTQRVQHVGGRCLGQMDGRQPFDLQHDAAVSFACRGTNPVEQALDAFFQLQRSARSCTASSAPAPRAPA